MSNDIFSKSNMIGGGTYAKFVNVGDSVRGVYVDRAVMQNTLKNCINAVYSLVQDNGDVILVQGKVPVQGKEERVMPELENLPFGTEVGVQFTETRPTKKGNDLKVLKVFRGQFKPDVLAQYKGQPVKLTNDDTLVEDISKML